MKVLDIACGKGRTSVYVAKKFGCRVVGIDLREDSIEEAKKFAIKNKVDHLVSFQVADAQNLPFSDNEFDMTLSQAMLILVDDKKKVVEEAARVLKPGGTPAWLELSWKKDPTEEFLRDATEGICAMCISNVITFDKWEKILNVDGVGQIKVHTFDMSFRGMIGMLRDEGLFNGFRVMYRYMVYPKIRRRMQKLDNFFKTYPEYIGYGIYIGNKK
jgi:SAM-dependent methyltransferase